MNEPRTEEAFILALQEKYNLHTEEDCETWMSSLTEEEQLAIGKAWRAAETHEIYDWLQIPENKKIWYEYLDSLTSDINTIDEEPLKESSDNWFPHGDGYMVSSMKPEPDPNYKSPLKQMLSKKKNRKK